MQVWNYKLPLAKLDMRCWTGPDKDIPLPGPVRQCLQHFANSTPDSLQVELGLVRPEFAFSLKERAEVRPCVLSVSLGSACDRAEGLAGLMRSSRTGCH